MQPNKSSGRSQAEPPDHRLLCLLPSSPSAPHWLPQTRRFDFIFSALCGGLPASALIVVYWTPATGHFELTSLAARIKYPPRSNRWEGWFVIAWSWRGSFLPGGENTAAVRKAWQEEEARCSYCVHWKQRANKNWNVYEILRSPPSGPHSQQIFFF